MTMKVVSASEDDLLPTSALQMTVVNKEEEEEAGVLVDRLDTTTTRYKMEIGPDKTKVMTNNPNGFQREIKIKGQRLEEVENFKYLGAIISDEGSKPEILSRIAQTTAALSRLNIIWKDKNISLASKVKLMRTLILSTFLYACESWTLTDNIKEWTGMGFGDFLRAAEDREGWKSIVATSSVVPRRPPRLRDWDEMNILAVLHLSTGELNCCKHICQRPMGHNGSPEWTTIDA